MKNRNLHNRSIAAVIFCVTIIIVAVIAIVILYQRFDVVPASTQLTHQSYSTFLTELESHESIIDEDTSPSVTESDDYTSPPTEQTNYPSSAPETEPVIISQPEELSSAAQSVGFNLNDLTAQQIILVRSNGSSAEISMYEKNGNGQWIDIGLSYDGYVGKNGVDIKSMEGDNKTPFGIFPIGDMFYIDTMPASGLNSFQITNDTYWVDDPNSVYYNQRVEGTGSKDWNSAEHMISYYASYKYGFVIDYNVDPIVPGKGSAIFFHVGSAPTAGCIAVSEEAMLSYLQALDKDKKPYILII